MGNCKDCSHWDQDDENCGFVDWVEQWADIPQDSFAIFAKAADDQGLCAGLKTGPLFGCIKFKQKT